MKITTNTGVELEIETKSENITRVVAEYKSKMNILLNWAVACAISWIFYKLIVGFEEIKVKINS